MQMHHSRLLFIVTELFRKQIITEDQKLALKFGIFNDDSRLMEFYFEAMVDKLNNRNLFDAPFEETSDCSDKTSQLS
jgi:hypothetical protein